MYLVGQESVQYIKNGSFESREWDHMPPNATSEISFTSCQNTHLGRCMGCRLQAGKFCSHFEPFLSVHQNHPECRILQQKVFRLLDLLEASQQTINVPGISQQLINKTPSRNVWVSEKEDLIVQVLKQHRHSLLS